VFVRKSTGDGDGLAPHVCKRFDGAVLFDHQRASKAVAQINHPDGRSLRPQSDRQRRYDERRLDAIRNQSFLDFRKSLEQTRQKDLSVIGQYGNIVSHRTRQLARHGNIRDADLVLLWGTIVVQDTAPIHVQPGVHGSD